jgi:hypothetical protein
MTAIPYFLGEIATKYFVWIKKGSGPQIDQSKAEAGCGAAHLCASYLGSGGKRIESSRPAWAKLVRPYFKNKMKTEGLGVQMIDMPSKHEALGWIRNTTKKEKKHESILHFVTEMQRKEIGNHT